jgi:hypothetical protein
MDSSVEARPMFAAARNIGDSRWDSTGQRRP